jgi:4-amino-4-deoxy-L-arabinose transferase-like glycosyltransferase
MAAGLLAALALAIAPVVVATDRNNTIDSTLILTLLLAAWAFIKATESGRLRYLLLAAVLVGIGFNIKMLQAYLPLPAFYALYFFGSTERLLRKIGRLALATALLLVISLSWVAIVDLTPASQRPYVGSSGDNSELSLIVGYNGLQRLLGMGFGMGANRGNGPAGGGFPSPGGDLRSPDGDLRQPGSAGIGTRPPMNPGVAGGFPGRGGPGGNPGGGPGGFGGTGQAGLLRLFTAPLSKEVSWLMPFGLVGALVVAFRARPRWPLAARHQPVVLWGGWLLTACVFFSVAGFFHEYYLSMLAPPLAALVGIGVIELWRMWQERWWLALVLLLIAAAGTLVLQIATAQAFLSSMWWLPFLVGFFVVGAALLILAGRQGNHMARAGFACVVAAMLITPGIWSGLTTLNSSGNQSLPAAYDGRSSGPANRGGLPPGGNVQQVNQALLDYLESHTQGTKYLMAVPSAMQGADYVLATGRPVLYLGGFNGQDKVVTDADLARLVTDGELRYIYWGGQGGGPGGPGGQSDVSNWVTSACVPVQGIGGMQVALYDCGGQTK